jgi:hypothetical protein
VLIPKENILVFGENLKLSINLRIIVIKFYNSEFIRSLSCFSLQGERIFYVNIYVLVCD